MTMNGVPVPPEGLDYIKGLEQWLEQYPNDVAVRSKLAELQRDPRFAEPDEPDDIMPQVPELSEFPVPPGLKKYIDATRIIAGASVPTTAACVAATFNLLAAEDIDVQSRANAPHPSGLYLVVGSESGWRKSSAYRETMQGHVEADERVDALYSEDDGTTEDGVESKPRGFSPRALRQDFTIEALLSEALESPQDHGRGQLGRIFAVGRVESFRRDNLSRTLSHFVNLWDGDPTSIDRRNPEAPEIFFYQRRLTGLIMAQVNVAEDLLFSQAAGNGFTARCLPSIDRERPKPPEDTSTSYQAATGHHRPHARAGDTPAEDQDANVELLRGVLRRPVIQPDHDARDLLAAASAKFDALADASRQPPRAGLLGQGPGADGPVRRHPGLCPDAGGTAYPSPGSTCITPAPRSTKQRPSSPGTESSSGPTPFRRPQRRSPAWPTRPSRCSGTSGRRSRRRTGPYRPAPSSPEWARPSSERTQRSENRSWTCWSPTAI